MQNQVKVPCPNCNTPITIDPQALISGDKFKCTSCNASVELGNQDKTTILNTLEGLKNVR